MYDRDYEGKTLNFEPSGGLTNASLIMQDKQTSTYWSLMKGKALAGKLTGQSLKELPVGEKTTWKQWREKHPNTKALSVKSKQDGRNPYKQYFKDGKGFRGLEAKDARLSTKSPIFAFRFEVEKGNAQYFAIAYNDFVSGAKLVMPDGSELFFYRHQDDELFRSTSAFVSKHGFEKNETGWVEKETGIAFDETKRAFDDSVVPLSGFDTFWYNWSLNNPDTKLLSTKPGNGKNGMLGSDSKNK